MLKRIKSFVRNLTRKATGKQYIQIVGRVTNGGGKSSPEFQQKFKRTARVLRERYPDAVVYNPIEQSYEGDRWEVCMFHCMDNILVERPIIYLLDNWKGSKGAVKEVQLAKELGLEVWYE